MRRGSTPPSATNYATMHATKKDETEQERERERETALEKSINARARRKRRLGVAGIELLSNIMHIISVVRLALYKVFMDAN